MNVRPRNSGAHVSRSIGRQVTRWPLAHPFLTENTASLIGINSTLSPDASRFGPPVIATGAFRRRDCPQLEPQRRRSPPREQIPALRLAPHKFCLYCSSMDEGMANRIIDLQAEITALRGAVRMLLHNAYNADESALAILREEAFQADRFQDEVPSDRSARYRDGVREAVAGLLDPFQPDNDEASRLANPASARTRPTTNVP